jgi:hypothetical protein
MPVVLMLTHLYSAHIQSPPSHKKDEERSTTNGNSVLPNAVDRQAADAQEFELEGLMSDDEDAETAAKHGNGRPRL